MKGIFILVILFLAALMETQVYAGEVDLVSSPYEACRNVKIADQVEYIRNGQSAECLQLGDMPGWLQPIKYFDPLKEGAQYLTFAQKVATKIVKNLEKSRAYAICSSECFSGAKVCSSPQSQKVTQCADRKKEITETMQIYAKRMRIELALANENLGTRPVTIKNVLTQDSDSFINEKLYSFETALPNPLGEAKLDAREMKEAKRRLAKDRSYIEQESTLNNLKYANAEWKAIKMMKNFDDHKENYRSIVYEQAPIFSVIEKPIKYNNETDPVWSDEQMAKAFKALSTNALNTREKVVHSINRGKLEFTRMDGEATGKWLNSLVGNEDHDLLFYMGMKNQVEEALREDPSYCGVATAMAKRIFNKNIQNGAIGFAGSLATTGTIQLGYRVVRGVFVLNAALSGAMASGISGMAMGIVTLEDTFRKKEMYTRDAATRSGLNEEQEGSALRTAEEVAERRNLFTTTAVLSPLNVAGSWSAGKTFYYYFGKRMDKQLPEMAKIGSSGRLSAGARDQVVDGWFNEKIMKAVKGGFLSSAEKEAFRKKEARAVLDSLVTEIERGNPEFFKREGNMSFLLKVAATTLRKEKGDPEDLGDKAKAFLLSLNSEMMGEAWDTKAQRALVQVFNIAVDELRVAYQKDPATYAKIISDPAAREKIMKAALLKSGAKERDLKKMLQCQMR